MESSAMYRYFTSRDELLTALIVEAYDAMGEVAEAAASSGGTAARRFRAVCSWALDHPHEYALLYGAPVPGYHAPELTTSAASRTVAVLAGLVRDAHQARELSAAKIPPLGKAMAAQARPIGQAIMPGVPLPVVARALAVWAQLFGQVNFEIFGRQHA
jgi:AcrR family transcriptional regulator